MAEGMAPTGRMPVLFAAHGAPVLLDDEAWVAELAAWAGALPRPQAILVISAHWERGPATIGATAPVPLVYDFAGFPERFHRLAYPAPGAPGVADRVRALLAAAGQPVADDPDRGLDHGVWVPLLAMYPAADVPVLQVSLPALDPQALVGFGRALAPLRDEGVLILGSGFLTHNLSYAFRAGTPEWAVAFDDWVADALARFDLEALAGFREQAPSSRQALPTWEHFAPLLVAAGATGTTTPRVTFPISGWWLGGAFTKRSVQFD